MRRTWWAWARPTAGAAVLGVVVWRLGTGPFLDGVRRIDAWSLAAAAGIALVTTAACAWRWSVVAHGLGVGVPLPAAVGAYYRSQFLNTTLPGGVLGDVDRAVRHGRGVGDVGRGLRAVGWERSAGQAVQILLTLTVLLVLPSPVHAWVPLALAVLATAALLAALGLRALPEGGVSRWARARRAAGADLRHGLFARKAWPAIALTSVVVVIGHAATFLIAARTAGVAVSPVRMLPLALLVLVAMSVPVNVGGWGPREGVAAWVFAMAGLGAAQGVATAVVYGVMVLVASLPGAVLLLVPWLRRDLPSRGVAVSPVQWRLPAAAVSEGVSHG